MAFSDKKFKIKVMKSAVSSKIFFLVGDRCLLYPQVTETEDREGRGRKKVKREYE